MYGDPLPLDEETYWEMERERTTPMATMGDAHREWHHNTGVPMGTPGCPQDACHPPDDLDDDYEPAPLPPDIACGHCGGRHANVATVHECAVMLARDERGMAEDMAAEDRYDRRPGGRWDPDDIPF